MKKFLIIICAFLATVNVALAFGGGSPLPFGPMPIPTGVQQVIQQQSQSGGCGQLNPGNVFDLRELNPLNTCSIANLFNRIIGAILVISIPIATIMILVGAFQMLTAAGEPEKFGTGKKTILYAVVGLGILLLARAIVAVIQSVLGVK